MCVGLVQELDSHRYDCAAKYLSVPSSYVLVRKQPTSAGLDHDDDSTDATYDYVPLLNNCHQLLPGYRVQQTGPGEVARRRMADSKKNVAAAKPSRSKQAKDRAPSRKR